MSYSAGRLARQIAAETSRRLQSQIPELAYYLGAAGWRTAERRLATVLGEILQPCCEVDKSIRKALPSSAETGALVSHYPVAQRLVRELTSQWTTFLTRFLLDWLEDAPELADSIGGSHPPERILAFGRETSDPHNGGKTVLILELARGRRVVYKPRSLGCERLFNELLEEIRARHFPWPLRVTGVLDYPDHGWMEHLARRECRHRGEVQDYFHRAGALLCLFHAFSGVDGHVENLIAAGDQPVLVDLETLLHPTAGGDASILRTGLLPIKSEPGYRLAAFGGRRPAPAHRHLIEIARGFSAMVDLLESQIDLAGWIARFAAEPRRRVLRSTEAYLHMRRHLLSPRLLHDENARRIALEEFAQGAASTSEEKQMEIAALDRLDIPRIVLTGMNGVPSVPDLRRELPIVLGSLSA